MIEELFEELEDITHPHPAVCEKVSTLKNMVIDKLTAIREALPIESVYLINTTQEFNQGYNRGQNDLKDCIKNMLDK